MLVLTNNQVNKLPKEIGYLKNYNFSIDNKTEKNTP